ncbi:MAG TPA: limonene-1,2-epoxide hydrolase family protein [Phenylobacterium sp.]|nr:limonene-1,2-epoxide hydrolase family protein [Phenylobacterium sp.]
MGDNETTVRDFIAAWSRLDVDELVGFFASDGVYHNMPMGPVAGRENLRGFIAGFLKGWTSTNWEVLTLIGRGDIVVAERVDRTMVGDKPVDLPCCGVFQLEGGKIKVWRDYFDLGTYRTALGA